MNGRSLSIHHLCPSPFLPTPQHTGKAFVPATTSKITYNQKKSHRFYSKRVAERTYQAEKREKQHEKAVKFFNDLERSLLLHPIQVC
jgi:hypothetical protein